MRRRSWRAAKELGSPCARLTINTAAEGDCSQHLHEWLLTPPGLVLLGTKSVVLPIPWSKQEGVGCVALCPWASTPPYLWGRKGQYYALLWTLLVKKNQIWIEEVFKSSARNVRENLMSAVQGSFLDWCWVHTSFAMPILVNSPLGTIHRQRLSQIGMGGYMQFYRNHKTNCGDYSSLH